METLRRVFGVTLARGTMPIKVRTTQKQNAGETTKGGMDADEGR